MRLNSYLVMGDPVEAGVFQVNLKSLQEVRTLIAGALGLRGGL